MVIGVDLLSQFGKITMNFADHTVQFCLKGKLIKLQGIQASAKANPITSAQWDRELRKEEENYGPYLCVISGLQPTESIN